MRNKPAAERMGDGPINGGTSALPLRCGRHREAADAVPVDEALHEPAPLRFLNRHLALALGLPAGWFADKLDRHASQLRLLHYPAPSRVLEPGQLRCGVHTDLGMMTILRNEAAAGGLQVRPRGSDWIDAPAVDDTFIVNIGHLLMRWTNDRWVSTPHRVAVPEAEARSRSRRLSIGYFTRPNYDAPIECISTCTDAANPPRYAPTTVMVYNDRRCARGAGPRQPD